MPSHILSYHTPCRLLLALFAVPFVAKRKGASTTTAFADSYYADRGDVTVTARKAREHLGEGERDCEQCEQSQKGRKADRKGKKVRQDRNDDDDGRVFSLHPLAWKSLSSTRAASNPQNLDPRFTVLSSKSKSRKSIRKWVL